LWDARLGSLLAAARDCWAGAVALAAGFGRAGGIDLLASARRTSLAMAGVLDLKLLKKDQLLLLLLGDKDPVNAAGAPSHDISTGLA
jgi:hypothetical protein